MGSVSKDGYTEYYDECTKLQDTCPAIHTTISSVITELDSLEDQYKEMVILIPKFGDEYDSLGANTKVNIEALQETVKGASDSLQEFNSSSVETSGYYKKAVEKDNEVTAANKSSAETRLNNRLRERNVSEPNGE